MMTSKTQGPGMSKFAYAVVVTTSSYVVGVKVLAWSLRSVTSSYPLILMYVPGALSQVDVNDLEKLGCKFRETSRIDLSGKTTNFANSYSYYEETWTKLQAFGLVEFERVILLDADMLVCKNVDELMEMYLPEGWIGAVYNCKCNPTRKPNYPPDWNPMNCAYTRSTGGASGSDDVRWDYFNSGLIVLRPGSEILDKMLNLLYNVPDLCKYRFPDQDFLNEVYKDKWLSLSYKYNSLKTYKFRHPSMWVDSEIRILHYIDVTKPWHDLDWPHLPEAEQKQHQYYYAHSLWFEAYAKMIGKISK